MTGPGRGRAVCAWVLAALAGCASTAARHDEGQRAFAAGSWRVAIDSLEEFLRDADCEGPAEEARCREARISIAEARLRLGDPKKAYFALESIRERTPRGGPVEARIDRLEKEAQTTFAARLQRSPGQGSLTVRLMSEPHKRLHLVRFRFFLDLHPLPTDNSVPYVEGTAVRAVPPTQIPAGHHELQVYVEFRGHPPHYDGYKFWAHSDYPFEVDPNASKEVEVRVVDLPVPYLADSFRIDFVTGAAAPATPSP